MRHKIYFGYNGSHKAVSIVGYKRKGEFVVVEAKSLSEQEALEATAGYQVPCVKEDEVEIPTPPAESGWSEMAVCVQDDVCIDVENGEEVGSIKIVAAAKGVRETLKGTTLEGAFLENTATDVSKYVQRNVFGNKQKTAPKETGFTIQIPKEVSDKIKPKDKPQPKTKPQPQPKTKPQTWRRKVYLDEVNSLLLQQGIMIAELPGGELRIVRPVE